MSSKGHQKVTKRCSKGAQKVLKMSSKGHQMVFKSPQKPSKGPQKVITVHKPSLHFSKGPPSSQNICTLLRTLCAHSRSLYTLGYTLYTLAYTLAYTSVHSNVHFVHSSVHSSVHFCTLQRTLCTL